MRRTGAIVVAVATAGVLLLTGCSSSIDVAPWSRASRRARRAARRQWTVQCPDSMEVQAGLTTNCMATSADGETST